MARLWHAGAEIDGGVSVAAQNTGPDGLHSGGTGTASRDTTVFRSGAASWKFVSGTTFCSLVPSAPSFVDGVTYFFRLYVNTTTIPTTSCPILTVSAGAFDCRFLVTTGTVQLFQASVGQGSPSVAAITDGLWHRIELKMVATATTTWTAAELLLDGGSVGTWSGSVARTNSWNFGFNSTGGTGCTINIDDVALNDSTGTVNNNYPGDGAVVLLKPTADSAVGTGWVTGAGGSTSLFAAVDNTPPVGVADTGTATSQIRNATSNATSYDATMTTYTAAGAGAGATVNAVLPVIATAAPVTTSAKQGTVGVVSNPAITNVALGATGTAGAFWSGLAGGTYGAGWKWSNGTMAEAPSVTLGTAPVMRVTNSTASTRIADVCAMFMYVDYTPAVAAAGIPDVGMGLTVT
jgi:hypothetical protein